MTSKTCKKCGTCCKNGGPALHLADLPLLADGHLTTHSLITIRQGEPVFSPLSDQVEPAAMELIKLNGTDNSWSCCFYQGGDSSCGIYPHRPLECRILKCWDTNELTNLIFKNTINRLDIIKKDDPLLEMIAKHEHECPYENLRRLTTAQRCDHDRMRMKNNQTSVIRDACREIIENDLSTRQSAVQQYNLSLGQELFYFGRPMFQNLSYFGLDSSPSS